MPDEEDEEKKQPTAAEQLTAAVQAKINEFVVAQLDMDLVKSYVAETAQVIVLRLFDSWQFKEEVEKVVKRAMSEQLFSAVDQVMANAETQAKLKEAVCDAVDEAIAAGAKRIKDRMTQSIGGET